MNYITLILVIILLLGLSDFFTSHVPQLQRIVWVIAALTVYTLFTIKYFYGQDMLNYYNYFMAAPTVSDAFFHPDRYFYAQGYTLLCALFRQWHLSFYWLTAFISTVYFAAVFLLWRLIPRKRTFALAILVVLDYGLMFAAFRQCLSVGFFIFMVLCLRDKRYVMALLFAFLCAWMHRAGVFVVSVSLAFYLFRNLTFSRWVYPVLLLVLCALAVLPMSRLWFFAGKLLPLSEAMNNSLTHHLRLGRQVQMVFVVYLMLLVCLSHYRQYVQTRAGTIATFVVAGVLLIVLLYQSYYLLNRIRSYFLPLIIVYVFRLIQQASDEGVRVPYGVLLRQVATVTIFVYMGHQTYSFHKNASKMRYPIYKACTVLDLRHHTAKELQERQLTLATRWWKADFKRGLQDNRVEED